MENFNRAALQRLTSRDEGPCVSLFLETHPAGKDGEQDVIRLNNLLREAEHDLSGHWMSPPQARDLLQQAAALTNDVASWQGRGRGLAVFMAPDWCEAYSVSVPLAAQVFVSRRFRVRPLLPLLEQQLSFYVLVISENQVAFYAANEHAFEQIEVPGLPTSLTEALNYSSADRGSQVHSAMQGVTGKQAGVFHGQGGQPDASQHDQLAYCSQINKAVAAWLGDSPRPLLLACTEPLAVLYRKKNTYRHLLRETLAGNHDHDGEHKLHQGAWQVVQPLLKSEASQAAVRFADYWGSPRVSDDLSQVVTAAIQGRVDALFYDPKAELFGQYNPPSSELEVTGNAADEDLVDLAAVETLRCGGTIHAITDQDVPTNAPLAAIFRY